MLMHGRQWVLVLMLMGGTSLLLSGCGQKGPLYLSSEFDEGSQPTELDEEELRAEQERLLDEGNLQDIEALKTKGYEGSLIPTR